MGHVETYRTYVQEVMQQYASCRASSGDCEVQTIFDTIHDHYQLVQVGWHNKHRVYGCILHVDLKDGKIWIQHDGIEGGIANEFVDLGVPKEEIVLAFHAPYKRRFTGFAVQ